MVRVPVARRSRSPWTEMNRLQREVENMLGLPGLGGSQDLWAPAVDVEETPDHLLFRAELPGMRREDMDIEIEDGVLTISGEKKEEERDETTQGLLYERRWGTFTRRFTLPRAVDANAITADYANGILSIRVPKAEEAKGRKIEIREASNGGREISGS